MRFLTIVIMMLLPVQALAGDISATFKNADGTTMTLSSRDPEHARMDGSPDAYTLMQGNKIYMVSNDGQGNWTAMDMDQMAGMMGLIGGGQDASGYAASYSDTGRTERIAGYTGKVFAVEVTDNGKLVSREEVVLSTHEDIRRINLAWLTMAERMSSVMSLDMAEAIGESRAHGHGGMLRYGDNMVLQSLNKGALPAGYFNLPPDAQKMQPAPASLKEPSVVQEEAEDVGQAAHDEAKQSTIDETREAVRDVFNSIFD